jgi:hypothetical protein
MPTIHGLASSSHGAVGAADVCTVTDLPCLGICPQCHLGKRPARSVLSRCVWRFGHAGPHTCPYHGAVKIVTDAYAKASLEYKRDPSRPWPKDWARIAHCRKELHEAAQLRRSVCAYPGRTRSVPFKVWTKGKKRARSQESEKSDDSAWGSWGKDEVERSLHDAVDEAIAAAIEDADKLADLSEDSGDEGETVATRTTNDVPGDEDKY